MPSKGKRKSKAVPSAPLKRQEPPPPCQPDCNCLGCLDNRSDTSMDTESPPPPPPLPPKGPLPPGTYKPLCYSVDMMNKLVPCDLETAKAWYYHLQQLVDIACSYYDLPRGNLQLQSTPQKMARDYQETLERQHAPPPPPPSTETGIQTEPPPTSSSAQTQTPTRVFRETKSAEAQTVTSEEVMKSPPQVPPPPKKQTPPKKSIPPPPPANSQPPLRENTPPPPPRSASPTQTRAVVLHAAPTRYKAGQMRRWVEEDNKGIEIAGIRWLLQEGRRLGKAASSLVIYLATPLEPGQLRMGRKLFRTTEYNWDRPTLAKEQGRA